MRLVKNTPAPIITDGFVGVCCRSIQKICHTAKLNLLWSGEKLGEQARDTRYDCRV